MDLVRRMDILMRAADAGSFARAAGILGLTPSAVSRAVAELELSGADTWRRSRANGGH
jgi:DNA-binding transcriptional LysR family regulator